MGLELKSCLVYIQDRWVCIKCNVQYKLDIFEIFIIYFKIVDLSLKIIILNNHKIKLHHFKLNWKPIININDLIISLILVNNNCFIFFQIYLNIL